MEKSYRRYPILLSLLVLVLSLALSSCDDGSTNPEINVPEENDNPPSVASVNIESPEVTPEAYDRVEQYIAIGKAELQTTIQPLLDFRQSRGMDVSYVSIEGIYVNIDGPDLQAKIKTYLKSVWNPLITQYVLLVGSTISLPMRELETDPEHPGYDCYSDLYYSHLQGDFDSDGDGIYGEYEEDDYVFSADIIVGRFPFDEPEILAEMVDKTIEFASVDRDYKNEILFAAGYLVFNSDSAILLQWIYDKAVTPNNFSGYRMYQGGGFIPSDEPLNQDNFSNRLISHPTGFILWAGHGSYFCAYEAQPFICFEDTEHFTNDYPTVIFSSSCRNGAVQMPNNLGLSLLKNKAVAFVGSTAETHPGIIGEASLLFLTAVDGTLNLNMPISHAISEAKALYIEQFFPLGWYDNGFYLRNYFTINYYGDPALRYWAN